MKCHQCGAMIDPTAHECPYCKVVTPAGVQARQRQEHDAQARSQWDAQQRAQQTALLRNKMSATALQALLFGVAGFFVCCTPLSIVGIVQGVRARKMAASISEAPPGKATIGLVISILATVTSIVMLTIAFIQSHYDKEAADERVVTLKKRVGDKPAAATIDHGTACALAEIYALENGFDGRLGHSLDRFECVGKYVASGDSATLESFRFRWSTSTKYDVNACFKKGARWYVTDLRRGSCSSDTSP